MQLKWIEDLLVLPRQRISPVPLNCAASHNRRCRDVRSLEEWVGVELVDRGTYPVELTQPG